MLKGVRRRCVQEERSWVKWKRVGNQAAEASAYVFNNPEWTVMFGRAPRKSEGIILQLGN